MILSALVFGGGLPAGALQSLTLDSTDGVTGSKVWAVLKIGPTIYLGGDFSHVGGKPRANLAAIDADSGTVTSWDPGADDAVFVLARGPGGSLFVGGKFNQVDGRPRASLASFDAAGALTRWNPVAQGGAVRGLTVDGARTYVGGTFDRIGDVRRDRLAAIHTDTGDLLPWNPGADDRVNTILVHPNGTIYVAGFFRNVGGVRRIGVAALDPSTGQPTSFVSQMDVPAYSLALQSPPGLLFVAGAGAGGTIGALNASTGETKWSAHGNGDTQAVSVSDTTVYVGGHFNTIADQSRLHFAAFDAVTGALLRWSPGANGDKGVIAMDLKGKTLLVGGDFTKAGDEPRDLFARFTGNV